jgi:holo-ACP synthase/holo-ACP synthase/triphosphoribosyl-dephospho-CoA synthase
MEEVSLMEMLDAREKRSCLQKALLQEYPCTLICLTLNIPGPVKVLPGLPAAYETGCRRILEALASHGITVIHQEEILEKTGYESFFCVKEDPDKVKLLMIALEDQDRLGRLFDIDVLRTDGSKLSREDLGQPGRRCLLCEKPAQVCGRSRSHSVAELVREITSILRKR